VGVWGLVGGLNGNELELIWELPKGGCPSPGDVGKEAEFDGVGTTAEELGELGFNVVAPGAGGNKGVAPGDSDASGVGDKDGGSESPASGASSFNVGCGVGDITTICGCCFDRLNI